MYPATTADPTSLTRQQRQRIRIQLLLLAIRHMTTTSVLTQTCHQIPHRHGMCFILADTSTVVRCIFKTPPNQTDVGTVYELRQIPLLLLTITIGNRQRT